MANPYDDVFGTGDQVTYAQQLAKHILQNLSNGPAMPSADQMKMPGTWMYGIPDVLNAVRGKQYETIAGTQRGKLSDETLFPGGGRPKPSVPQAGVLSQSAPQGTGDIKTASLPPETDTGSNITTTQPGGNPVTPQFLAKVRQIENSGKYKGYGGANNAYYGAYQFNRQLMRQYNVNPNSSPQEWDAAANEYFNDLREQFKQRNNREPSEGQLYLLHQRGPGGQQMGMDNPNRPEWVNMYETAEGRQRALQQGKANAIAWAQRSVKLNVPANDPTRKELEAQYGKDWYLHMTSGQFQPIWHKKFDTGNGEVKSAENTPIENITPQPGGVLDKFKGPMPPGAMGDYAPGPDGHLQYSRPWATGGNAGPIPDSMKTPPAGFGGQAGQPEIKGQAGNDVLSGENTSQIETGANPQRVAQAFPTTPTHVGPSGAIPPANPIESDAQLRARMRAAESDEQRNQIYENYLKRKEGRTYKTLGGEGTVTPTAPGQQPLVSERVTHTIPFSVGDLHLQLTPDGKGGFSTVLPGGETKDFKNADEVWKWAQEGHARGTALNTEAEVSTKRYQDVLGHTQQTYQSTADRGRQLALAQKLVDDPKFISGSLQEQREMIHKFLRTFGVEKPANASDITQTFVKLVAGNILDDIKGLGGQGLGQIRAKEMEIIEKMNASPNMSPGAVRAVVTLMRKANDRMNDFNDQVLDYSSTHNDKIDAGFYRKMQKYYRDNPLISETEEKEYKKFFGASPEKKWTKGKDGVYEFK